MSYKNFSIFIRKAFKQADIDIKLDLNIPEKYNKIISKVRKIAEKYNFNVYLVGGIVRDLLLGLPVKDLDFVVDGPSDNPAVTFAELLDKEGVGSYKVFLGSENEQAKKFGVAKVKIDDEIIDFVMPRKEKYSEFSRKPEVERATLEEDAIRRDFTVNALYYDILNEKVIDPTGKGLEDLKNNVLRSANPDPHKMFFEDPLRLLRAVRFSVVKNFKLEPELIDAIKQNAYRLSTISAERIRDEFEKILTVKENPSKGIRLLRELGLLKYIIPELEKTYDVYEQPGYHLPEPVFEHIMRVLDNIPPDLTQRLSALLHDIGKPTARKIEEGIVTFFGHADIGAEEAKKILQKLRFPNNIIEDVSKLVKYHMTPHLYTSEWTDKAIKKFLINIGHLIDFCLELAKADRRGSGVKMEDKEKLLEEFETRIRNIKEQPQVLKPKPILNGFDLMELFNSEPGPWLKKVLEFVYDLQLENPNITKEEAIEKVKEFVIKENINVPKKASFVFFKSALKQFIKENNKISELLNEYKLENLSMDCYTFQDFMEEKGNEEDSYLIQVKIDGELTALVKNKFGVFLYSRGGRVRGDTFLTKEFENFEHDGIFIGELYALSDTGGPQTYAKSLSLLRNPKDLEDEKRYRISLFDIYELDGKKLKNLPYEKRFDKLVDLIYNKYEYIHVAPFKKGSLEDVRKLWNEWVLSSGWEGLVVRNDKGIYKIKPMFTIDLVVIGVTKNKTHPNQIGALITAFVLPGNRFLLSSKVGTGFSEEDRIKWLEWAKENKVNETEKEIYVNPNINTRIVEVKVEEFREKKEKVLHFRKDTYEEEGEDMSISLRKPVFLRIREDKKLDYRELGRKQVPKWDEYSKTILSSFLNIYDFLTPKDIVKILYT